MPQLLGIIVGLAILWVVFLYVWPAIVGLIVGYIWSLLIKSNRKREVNKSRSYIIKLKEENRILENRIRQVKKKREEMLLSQRKKIIRLGIEKLSDELIKLREELSVKYERITSKYYVKEFGESKIKEDMRGCVEGKFPEKLWTSDDFRYQCRSIYDLVTNEEISIDDLRLKALFEEPSSKFIESVKSDQTRNCIDNNPQFCGEEEKNGQIEILTNSTEKNSAPSEQQAGYNNDNKSRANQYIVGILMLLLIVAPLFIAYIYSSGSLSLANRSSGTSVSNISVTKDSKKRSIKYSQGAKANLYNIVVKSTKSLSEAKRMKLDWMNKGHPVRIIKSKNGWYAISVGSYPIDKAKQLLSSKKGDGDIPKDSYIFPPSRIKEIVN